jgi:putative ABC transport system permease protein
VPGRPNDFASVISTSRGMTDDGQTMPLLAVDYDFIDTYGLELAGGEDLSRETATDSTEKFLINESAMQALGWASPDEALGVELTRQFQDSREVSGVVKDFHYHSLQNAIEPLVLLIRPDWYRYVSVKIRTEDVPGTLQALEEQWLAFSPSRPMEYFFLDDDYDRQYRTESRLATILSLFTGLAILIACLGLFGLASFVTEQRTKEIGVRKVLGASAGSIIVLLSGDFTRLVLLATLLAFPAAYFLMDSWLQAFPYRISIGPGAFVVAALLGLATALLTVGYQSVRAALANPVDTLRYE